MRINRYIAASGAASRRKADQLIKEGKVKINGILTKEVGFEVEEGWVVEVEGRVISPAARKIYLMLNKPKGFITTVKDESNRPTVMDLLQDVSERIFPIGRLDNATSGMLLLTNDGDFAHNLLSPKKHVYKTYEVLLSNGNYDGYRSAFENGIELVAGMMTKREAEKLEKGVVIDGVRTAPAQVEILRHGEHSTVVEIRIYEGRNRQVRRMCEAVGHKVLDLHRSAIGGLGMGHLKEGHYKKLRPQEVEMLRRAAGGEQRGKAQRKQP